MDFAALRARAVQSTLSSARVLLNAADLTGTHLVQQEQAATSARAQLHHHTAHRPTYRPPPSASSSTSSLSSGVPTPPPRTAAAPPPPPAAAQPAAVTTAKPHRPIDSTSDADKDALFQALDEFFSARFGVDVHPLAPVHQVPSPPDKAPKPSRPGTNAAGGQARATTPGRSLESPPPQPRARAGPPPISRANRPVATRTATAPQTPSATAREGRSYPPAESHSSAALSLLHWLLDPPDLAAVTSVPFFLPPSGSSPASPSSPPSTSTPTPPPLEHRSDVRSAYSWTERRLGGRATTTYVACFLFGDASIAWIRLAWDPVTVKDGTVLSEVERAGRYRPRPRIDLDWDADRLDRASETYGFRIVRFAEEAVVRRQPVARGECWDLANEALAAACSSEPDRSAPSIPRPFPSIARTHGALLYYAKASAASSTVGTWTGGDLYVRPGDIVEWRSVTIREVGMAPGSYSTLGDPEHTAIILSAGTPLAPPSIAASPPYLDSNYPLSHLVSLTVVEQSLGQAPAQKTYDLAAMSHGEVWIYRPCGLKDLVGTDDIAAQWPPPVQSWQIGELE
ncbi:hypothetical protein JCM3774_000496 [Rhodotorula dairenensis]